MEDDEGVQDEREIWEVTHVSKEDLETTEDSKCMRVCMMLRSILLQISWTIFSPSTGIFFWKIFLYVLDELP